MVLRSVRLRPAIAALLAALLALVLASCGESDDAGADGGDDPTEAAETEAADGEPTGDDTPMQAETHEEVLAAVEGLAADEREAALLELVDQQGRELVWFSAANPAQTEALAAAFGEQYDIEMVVYRAGTSEMSTRLLQEAEAGLEGSADIFDTDGMTVQLVIQEGHTVPYRSPHLDDLLPEAVGDGWQANRFNLMAPGWNTDLVSEDEQPTTWEDLASDRFDGQLIVGQDDVDWFKTLWEYWADEQGKSDEEIDQLFRDMVSNSLVVRSRSQRAQMIGAGQAHVSASGFTFLVDNLAAEGAPVTWHPPVEPIIIVPQGSALMKNGGNPAAAILFQDWILTEGQAIIEESGATPARADLAAEDLAPGVEFRMVDTKDLLENNVEWTERWDELTRSLGEEVPDN